MGGGGGEGEGVGVCVIWEGGSGGERGRADPEVSELGCDKKAQTRRTEMN